VLRRFAKVAIGLVFAAGLLMLFGGVDILIASATERSWPEQSITICHATGSSAQPYVPVDVKVSSDGRVEDPRGAIANDVVPPYTYAGVDHPGTNWTPAGQALWYRGCQAASGGVAGTLQPARAVTGADAQASPTPQAIMPIGDTPTNPVLGVYLVLVGLLTTVAGALGWIRFTV
jgi:hypothetical protein